MRHIAMLGLILLLPACSGLGGMISDTVSFNRNPNLPPGDSDNMLRVRGEGVETVPLLPEPGNVWPGPPQPEPTLGDLQREQNQGELPPPAQVPVVPHPQPRGSSTPPESVQPNAPAPLPLNPPALRNAPSVALPPPVPGVVQTPQGSAVISTTRNGQQTYTLPNGVTGRAISNGNGTVTLIGPDGSVQSVPAPR